MRKAVRPTWFGAVAIVVALAIGCGSEPHLAAQGSRQFAPTSARRSTPRSPKRPGPPPPTWAMFGDSTALSIALVAGSWERATGQMRGVGGVMLLGCGIVRGGRRSYAGIEDVRPECDSWPTSWADEVAATAPDLAVVSSCQWETVDHLLPGDTTWRSLGDPTYDDVVKREYLQAADVLATHGSLVVWLTCAHFFEHPDDARHADARRSHDPARVDRLNAIIRDVAAARPGTVRVVDVGDWVEPREADRDLRPDGSHFGLGPGDDLVPAFLGPAMVDVWRRWWPGPSRSRAAPDESTRHP